MQKGTNIDLENLEKLLEKLPRRAEFSPTRQIHLLSLGQLWTFPDKN